MPNPEQLQHGAEHVRPQEFETLAQQLRKVTSIQRPPLLQAEGWRPEDPPRDPAQSRTVTEGFNKMALEYNVTWGDLIVRDLNSRFLDRTRQISTITQAPAAEADREIEHLTNIQLSMSMAVYTEALVDNLATISENYARNAANIPSQFRNPEYEQRTRQMLQDMIQVAPRFSLLQQLHYFESSFSFLSGRLNQLRAIGNQSPQDQADIRQFSLWVGANPDRANFTGVFGKRIQALRQQLRVNHNQAITVRNERGVTITFSPIAENISPADLFREIRRMEEWVKGQFMVTADVEILPRQRGGVAVRSRPHIAHAMYFSALFNYRTHLGDRIASGNAPPEELLHAITTDEQIAERFRQYIGNTLQLQRDFIILAAHRGSLFPEAATKVTASLSPEEKAKYESMHLAGHGFDHLLMSQQDTLDVYTRTLLDQVLAFSTVPVLLDGMIGAVDRLVGGLDAFVLHLLQIGQGFNNYATTLFGGPWLLPLVRNRLGTNAELAAHLRSEANRLRGLRERLSKIRDETEKRITNVRNQMPKLIANLREASNRLDRATTEKERLAIRNECINIVSQIHTQYDGLVDTVVNLDVRLTNGRAFHAENAAALREANSLHVAAAIASDALLFIILRRLGANGGLLGRGGVLDQYRILRMARSTPLVGDVLEAFNAQTRPAVGLFNWVRRTIASAPLPEATPILPPNVQKTLNSTITRLQEIERELDRLRSSTNAADRRAIADLLEERRRLGESVASLLDGAPDSARQAFARQMLGTNVLGRLNPQQLQQLNNAIIEIHNMGAGRGLQDVIDFGGSRMTVLEAKTLRMRQLLVNTNVLTYPEARQLMSGFCGDRISGAVQTAEALVAARNNLSTMLKQAVDRGILTPQAATRIADSPRASAIFAAADTPEKVLEASRIANRAANLRASGYGAFPALDVMGVYMAWVSYQENGRNLEIARRNGNTALEAFFREAQVVNVVGGGMNAVGALSWAGIAILPSSSSGVLVTSVNGLSRVAPFIAVFSIGYTLTFDTTGLNDVAQRLNLSERDWANRSPGEVLSQLRRLSQGRFTEGEMSWLAGTRVEHIFKSNAQVEKGIKNLEETARALREILTTAYILQTSHLPRRQSESDRAYADRLETFVKRQRDYISRVTQAQYNTFAPQAFRDARNYAEILDAADGGTSQQLTVDVNGRQQVVDLAGLAKLPFQSDTQVSQQLVLDAYRRQQRDLSLLQLVQIADVSEGADANERARRLRQTQDGLHSVLLSEIQGDLDRFSSLVEGFDFDGVDISIFGIGPQGETNARNLIRYGVSVRLQDVFNRIEPRLMELITSDPVDGGQTLLKAYDAALGELHSTLQPPPNAVYYRSRELLSGQSIRGTSSAMQPWHNELAQELQKRGLRVPDGNGLRFLDPRNFTRAGMFYVERQGREIIREIFASRSSEFPVRVENPDGSFSFCWKEDWRAEDLLQVECLDGRWRFRIVGRDHSAYAEWRDVTSSELPVLRKHIGNFTTQRRAGLGAYPNLVERLARLTGRA